MKKQTNIYICQIAATKNATVQSNNPISIVVYSKSDEDLISTLNDMVLHGMKNKAWASTTLKNGDLYAVHNEFGKAVGSVVIYDSQFQY